MEIIDATRLRYFLAVADEGHVGRAAARLGIAQPSLSQQMRRLEEDVGTPLLRRHPKGVDLTEAGAVLARDARPAYAALEAAVLRARARRRVAPSCGSASAIPRLRATRPSRPRPLPRRGRCGARRSSTSARSTSEAVRLVRTGGVDVAFVYDPLEDTEVDAVPAFVDTPVVVAAGRARAGRAGVSSPSRRSRPIRSSGGSATRSRDPRRARVGLPPRGFEPQLIDIPDVPGVLGTMLAEGVGVSVISEFVARSIDDPALSGGR